MSREQQNSLETRVIAERMINGGWRIVPIKPNSKAPVGVGWQNRTFTPDDFGDINGIGVVTGHGVFALDIDSYDPDVANTIAEEAKQRFGETLERVGHTFGNLDDSLRELADEFREYLVKEAACFASDFVVRRHSDEALFLKNPTKVLSDWLASKLDYSELATIQRRKPDILKALSVDGGGSRSHKVDWQVLKGVRFR